MTQTLAGPAAAVVEAAQRRAAARPGRATRGADFPAGAARIVPFASRINANLVDRAGEQRYHIHGVASLYEQHYEMWDAFGPYNEVVSRGAGAASLAARPDVAFLTNHKGITMARTTNGSLELRETDGLEYDAYVNPKRQDVRDLVTAIDDKDVTESSFAFMITDGGWNADMTEFRIDAYDLDRGDVSAVNYGANPYTSVAARSREILADIGRLPAGAARVALGQLQERLSVVAIDIDDDDDGEVDDVPCPSCGAMNADDAVYCDQCGAPMNGATPQANATTRPTQERGRSVTHWEALLELD